MGIFLHAVLELLHFDNETAAPVIIVISCFMIFYAFSIFYPL